MASNFDRELMKRALDGYRYLATLSHAILCQLEETRSASAPGDHALLVVEGLIAKFNIAKFSDALTALEVVETRSKENWYSNSKAAARMRRWRYRKKHGMVPERGQGRRGHIAKWEHVDAIVNAYERELPPDYDDPNFEMAPNP